MYIRRLLYNQYSPFIISIILGVGLSCLFQKVCNDRNCLVFKAPPFEKIKDKIYQYNYKCYKFNSNAMKCDPNKQIINF